MPQFRAVRPAQNIILRKKLKTPYLLYAQAYGLPFVRNMKFNSLIHEYLRLNTYCTPSNMHKVIGLWSDHIKFRTFPLFHIVRFQVYRPVRIWYCEIDAHLRSTLRAWMMMFSLTDQVRDFISIELWIRREKCQVTWCRLFKEFFFKMFYR